MYLEMVKRASNDYQLMCYEMCGDPFLVNDLYVRVEDSIGEDEITGTPAERDMYVWQCVYTLLSFPGRYMDE